MSLFLALSHHIVSLPFMQAMIEEGQYEAEREANIARNNLLLTSLGFAPMVIPPLQKDGCAPKRSRGLPPNSPPPPVHYLYCNNPYVSFPPYNCETAASKKREKPEKPLKIAKKTRRRIPEPNKGPKPNPYPKCNPHPNPNPKCNPHPNPISNFNSYLTAEEMIEQGPPTARRSRGKSRDRKRDEASPPNPYP